LGHVNSQPLSYNPGLNELFKERKDRIKKAVKKIKDGFVPWI